MDDPGNLTENSIPFHIFIQDIKESAQHHNTTLPWQFVAGAYAVSPNKLCFMPLHSLAAFIIVSSYAAGEVYST